MIVSKNKLPQVFDALNYTGEWSLDTETDGLKETARMFSIILANDFGSLYFNFKPYPLLDSDFVLDKELVLQNIFSRVLSNTGNTIYMHNAKFDWRMLLREGHDISARVVCTYAMERLLRNNYNGKGAYSLALSALRRGWKKDEAVEDYITKHKLYTLVEVEGKKEPIKEKHFDQVPFQIIAPYGERDAEITLKLGKDQKKKFSEIDHSSLTPKPTHPLRNNEVELTRTLVHMEHRGIRLNVPLILEAMEWEKERLEEARAKFKELTARDYEDSRALFREVFDNAGEKYPLTEKGNPSFAGDVLDLMTSPIASVVNTIRHHEKRIGTYYSSYLYYKNGDEIHANALQAGTTTGRMSYTSPNMQNQVKREDGKYHLREVFIPREGHFFYDIDYEQMEYKLMLDYSGETKLIEQVLAGADLHQATADMLRVSRDYAKTLNFAILYGSGPTNIALMLDIKESEARELMNIYFARLPRVERFIDRVKAHGKMRKYVYNWLGRRCYIASSSEAYKLPNHLIQGGCADIVKVAMNQIRFYMEQYSLKTAMLLQVHDELLFEVPYGEEFIGPELQKIMESVYVPQNGLGMTTSLEHSTKSWGKRHRVKGIYENDYCKDNF